MKKKISLTVFAIGLTFLSTLDLTAGLNIKKPKISKNKSNPLDKVDVVQAVDAGGDLVKAATLTDEDVKNIARQYADHADTSNSIAPEESDYAQRLQKLTAKHLEEDGLKLNFKVYLADEVNAFALADGSVRIYSGLMDLMTDEEVLFVIGHEIGHVLEGHSKEALRTAYLASAGRKAAASNAGITGDLAASDLGALGEHLLNAKFSRVQETQSDDYGQRFLKKHGYNTAAAASALQKLDALTESKSSILSTHPDPGARASRMEKNQ